MRRTCLVLSLLPSCSLWWCLVRKPLCQQGEFIFSVMAVFLSTALSMLLTIIDLF